MAHAITRPAPVSFPAGGVLTRPYRWGMRLAQQREDLQADLKGKAFQAKVLFNLGLGLVRCVFHR